MAAGPGNSLWRAVIPLVVPTEGGGGDQTERPEPSEPWPNLRPRRSTLCFLGQLIFYISFRLSSSARREDRRAQWEHYPSLQAQAAGT